MSLRRDLPHIEIPVGMIRAAAADHGDGPRSVMAAVDTVGSQVREHRAHLDGRLNEIQASLQHTQQAVAQFEANGGGAFGARGGSGRISAEVLKDAETSLEDLRSGRQKSVRMSLETFYPQAAAITSGAQSNPRERDQEVYGPMYRPMSIRDLLVTRPTTAPGVEFLRATRTGSADLQAAEGDQKAELGLGFELMTASVKTIAAWVPASRQALDDSTMLGDYIDMELRDALRLKEDQQLLKGSGTGANIQGLWTLGTAYNRGTGTSGAVGASDKPLDTLRRAVTQLQLARGVASGIVLNPVGLETLELEKDAEGRYMMAFEVKDENGGTVVWRVPTVITDAIGTDEFMVGDFLRAARLYDRQQATVEVATQHADYFTRNMIAILAEERVALTTPRPDLLIIGKLKP